MSDEDNTVLREPVTFESAEEREYWATVESPYTSNKPMTEDDMRILEAKYPYTYHFFGRSKGKGGFGY